MVNAKLFVPAGGLDQDNGGETFSPTQFGLDLWSPAFFFASGVPSLGSSPLTQREPITGSRLWSSMSDGAYVISTFRAFSRGGSSNSLLAYAHAFSSHGFYHLTPGFPRVK